MARQQIALLGHPISHSISPMFQQAALDALGIDARYEAWDTTPEDLPATVERLRSGDFLGANVTVPSTERPLISLWVPKRRPISAAAGSAAPRTMTATAHTIVLPVSAGGSLSCGVTMSGHSSCWGAVTKE